MGFEKSILGNLNEAQKIAASHIQGVFIDFSGSWER